MLYQQPATYVADLRLSKRLLFRERYGLEFLGEAFNLANHPNVTRRQLLSLFCQ